MILIICSTSKSFPQTRLPAATSSAIWQTAEGVDRDSSVCAFYYERGRVPRINRADAR